MIGVWGDWIGLGWVGNEDEDEDKDENKNEDEDEDEDEDEKGREGRAAS